MERANVCVGHARENEFVDPRLCKACVHSLALAEVGLRTVNKRLEIRVLTFTSLDH
jgi:hypothetical protein